MKSWLRGCLRGWLSERLTLETSLLRDWLSGLLRGLLAERLFEGLTSRLTG